MATSGYFFMATDKKLTKGYRRQLKRAQRTTAVTVSAYDRPELPYSCQPAPLRPRLNRPPGNANSTAPRRSRRPGQAEYLCGVIGRDLLKGFEPRAWRLRAGRWRTTWLRCWSWNLMPALNPVPANASAMRDSGRSKRSRTSTSPHNRPSTAPQIARLEAGGWLAEARNIVLLGPPGTGKNHCES